jgi:hypothetical protein
MEASLRSLKIRHSHNRKAFITAETKRRRFDSSVINTEDNAMKNIQKNGGRQWKKMGSLSENRSELEAFKISKESKHAVRRPPQLAGYLTRTTQNFQNLSMLNARILTHQWLGSLV